MSREQRIFRTRVFFAALLSIAAGFPFGRPVHGEDRTRIADDSISIVVPDGWEESDLNAGRAVAGYETADNRTSAFFVRFNAGGGSMQELIDGTIANFAKEFTLRKESEAKTGQVAGPGEKKWPAIFKTLEGTVTKGEREFEMRFYVLIFDVGTDLYMLQATTTLPVREVRERQVYELIRSIVAKPRIP